MKDLFDQGPKKIIEGSLGEVEYVDDFLTLSEADEFLKKKFVFYFSCFFPKFDSSWIN